MTNLQWESLFHEGRMSVLCTQLRDVYNKFVVDHFKEEYLRAILFSFHSYSLTDNWHTYVCWELCWGRWWWSQPFLLILLIFGWREAKQDVSWHEWFIGPTRRLVQMLLHSHCVRWGKYNVTMLWQELLGSVKLLEKLKDGVQRGELQKDPEWNQIFEYC